MRTVLSLLLICGITVPCADARAQSVPVDTLTIEPALPLCPMPVHAADSTRSAIRMPVYREPAGVHYFMRIVPARCHNPLASAAAKTSPYALWWQPGPGERARWLLRADSMRNRERR